MNWKRRLHRDTAVTSFQLNDHRAFVKFLVQPGLQFVEHLHRNTDDGATQLLMNHSPHPCNPCNPWSKMIHRQFAVIILSHAGASLVSVRRGCKPPARSSGPGRKVGSTNRPSSASLVCARSG